MTGDPLPRAPSIPPVCRSLCAGSSLTTRDDEFESLVCSVHVQCSWRGLLDGSTWVKKVPFHNRAATKPTNQHYLPLALALALVLCAFCATTLEATLDETRDPTPGSVGEEREPSASFATMPAKLVVMVGPDRFHLEPARLNDVEHPHEIRSEHFVGRVLIRILDAPGAREGEPGFE